MEGGNVAPGLEDIKNNAENIYGGEQQHFGSPGGTQYQGGSPYEGSSADGDGSAGNLIVNYLPSSVTEEALRALFTPYGEVTSCKLMKDKHTGDCWLMPPFA
jgi:RNA recognition motif-containing protein